MSEAEKAPLGNSDSDEKIGERKEERGKTISAASQQTRALRGQVSGNSQTRGLRSKVLSGSSRYGTLGEEELARLTKALSTRLSHKSQDGDDGDIDVDALLGRVFKRGPNDRTTPGGVAFRNLTVKGVGFGAKEHVSVLTILSFLAWPPNLVRQIKRKKAAPTRNIVNGFTGAVEAGELLLVCGRPGSGCTSFLKAVAGHDQSFLAVEGDVSYGGLSMPDMQKHYRASVTFNDEVDQHLATINVKETLSFAIKCRTPAADARTEGETADSFRQTFLEVLGAVFGLTRVFKTKLGNELIRGVSGGEKKRVSIAETLTSRATVQMWDSATRGLDSSTALEYVQALRAVANMSGSAIGVALYQVSDELTKLFDKILVIEGGQQVYMGPVDEAQEYFESLGFERPERQPLADYLSSVGDLHARSVRSGYEERIPRTADQLAEAFKKSELWASTQREVDQYFEKTPKHDPKQSKNVSIYSLSFVSQIMLLARREYLVQLGNPIALSARYIASVVQSLIIGSLFYNIAPTTNGAFLYGGVMFFSLLFNALLSMSQLSAAFEARPILAKQRAFAFYRPGAWSLAVILADVPILFVQIIVFSVVIYFMAQLGQTASQFFIFVLFLFITSMCITALFRCLAAITPDLNRATPLSGVILQGIVVYTGYLIPYDQMPYWLRFIRWINPLAYGFEALQANQFYNLELLCVENSFVPYGADYTSTANRVCTLAGAQPGQQYVNGADYIASQFGYTRSHLWRNFGAICGFYVAYLLIATFGFEYSAKADAKGADVLVYKRGGAPLEVQEALEGGKTIGDVEASANTDGKNGVTMTDEEAKERQRQIDKEVENHLVKHDSIFSWHHVNYFVGQDASRKQLLTDVSGFVKPGVLTALVGESGAGKTTLLTTLSQRQGTGVVEGDIFVDGQNLKPSFARNIGFVEQQDIHQRFTTVREALIFSATLRQHGVSHEEKIAYVDEIIKLLELTPIENAIVGIPGVGLNVEQRKRLTIGVELVAKPELLVFLDEPTSGLDANASSEIMRFLRKLADAGLAILCTIHQPSSQLFNQFDALVLLARGGRTMYFGETGPDSQKLIDYFQSHGSKPIPEGYNPAEWMLEVIGAGAASRSKVDWHDVWNKSDEKKAMLKELDHIVTERRSKAGQKDDRQREDEDRYYASSFGLQLKTVLVRNFLTHGRNTQYLMGKFMLHIIAALLNGFTFLRLGTATIDIQNRLFTTFLSVTIAPPLVQQLQPVFIGNRSLWEAREGKARIYGWLPLTLSGIIVEMPFALIAGVIYFNIWWPMTLSASRVALGGRYAFGFLNFLTFELFVASFAQMIAALAPNAVIAALLVPFFFSFVVSFSGVLNPPPSIPTFWRRWMIYVTPFRWLLAVYLVNEDHDLPITCTASEFLTIIPPSGSTCGQYMQAFFNGGGAGYLADPNATGSCSYCQYAVGDQYLPQLEINWHQRWEYYGFFVAYLPLNVCLVLLFTWLRLKGLNPFYLITKPIGFLIGGIKRLSSRGHPAPAETPASLEASSGSASPREKPSSVHPDNETTVH